MEFWTSPFIVPLGVFLMVVLIVAIVSFKSMREKELEAHYKLRYEEMEHDRKMKQMEVEKARIELERARAGKSS
jgi:hypothetical protein